MFDITCCSNQDFAARMGVHSSNLLAYTSPDDRTAFNCADALLAKSIHDAMGYRREHSNPLEF
jgi:hypothetical protein